MEPLQGDEAAQTAAGRLVARTCEVDAVPVRSFLRAFSGPRTVWAAPGEPTVAGCGAAARVVAEGPDRFEAVREAADAVLSDADADGPAAVRPRLFGGLAFHDDHRPGPPWTGFPAARFVLPAVQLTLADGAAFLTVAARGPDPGDVDARLERARERVERRPPPTPVGDGPGVVARKLTTPRDAWTSQVSAAVARIERGALRKVALAQALRATLHRPASVPAVLARLRERYPDCFRFLVEPAEGATLFAATPERLLSLRGRSVRTGALAGSRPRGESPAADERLAAEMAESDKDRTEHELVAEAIRDQLRPVAASVSTGERTLRRLATVQHLYTPISAELSGDEHVLSLVSALHPTPAVGGLPPAAAMETIRETETLDGTTGRGWYAGPVGWVDAAGDGTFAVAIRSAVTAGTEATLYAGNGIVADSDPDEEWEEVLIKYRPVLDALE